MTHDTGTVKGGPLRRWWSVAVAASSMSLVAIAGAVTLSVAVASTPAGAAASCTAPQTASVHYKIVATPAPTKPTTISAISAITLSTLGGSCNGVPAKVLFKGNTAGDPTTSSVHLLSTATSGVNPCTGGTATTAPTVTKGSIMLTLCATHTAPGRYVSVHDLTHLTLTVGGTTVTVTPKTSPSTSNSGSTTGSNSGNGTRNLPVSTVTSSASGLAFTGADIAAMTIAGLLIILLGLFLLLMSRRRRSQATGGPTP